MKKMLMMVLVMGMFAGFSIANTPTITQEECILTVNGDTSLDGWWMCIEQADVGIGVGFFDTPDVCEGAIELSGYNMSFDLGNMGYDCSLAVPNDVITFDSVKSLYR